MRSVAIYRAEAELSVGLSCSELAVLIDSEQGNHRYRRESH